MASNYSNSEHRIHLKYIQLNNLQRIGNPHGKSNFIGKFVEKRCVLIRYHSPSEGGEIE